MLKNITIFFITAFILGVGGVFSYDNINTHPQLSRAAENVYNNSTNPNKITAEQMKWIEYGAAMEDTDPRYLNHFYNPKTGQGFKDGIWFGAPTKQWAQKQVSATGDYSYQTILDNYRIGNKDRAWQGVGHILHLIQDMSVPAHVRNDGHKEGDVYEYWAEHFGNIDANNIRKTSISSLDQVFDVLANYTYDNFFSKDTLDFNKLSKFKVKKEVYANNTEKEYVIGMLNGIEYKIVEIDRSGLMPIYEINNNYVNQSYWNLLAPQAIGYSAGVIELFTNEFKKIDDQKAAELASMNWFQKLSSNLNDAVIARVDLNNVAYAWGDAYMAMRPSVVSGFENTVAAIKTTGSVAKTGGELVVDTSKTVSDKLATAVGEVKGVFVAAADDKKASQVVIASVQNKTTSTGNIDEVKIARVIDGDTIELKTGEKVRYIGIDSPELNGAGSSDDECLAWAAKVRNEQLVQSGTLRLVSDVGADKDGYGRLLRYVYAGNTFVNGQLANEGFAKSFFCQAGWNNCPVMKDATRKKIILDAANAAVANKRGLYSGVCERKLEVIKEVTLAPIAENIVQPIAQDVAKNVQIIFNNGSVNDVAETEDVVIILDDGINDNENDEEQQEKEVATSTDDDIATTTDDVATSTPEVATSTEDVASSTPEIATSTEPLINMGEVEITLFGLDTGSEDITASTTLGLRIDGINSQVEYFLSELEDGLADDSVWLTQDPESFVVTETDYGLVGVYLWIKQNGEVLYGHTYNEIILDKITPNIEFNTTPPQITDSNNANFDISCSDNSQDLFDENEWGEAVTWNYKLDDGDWLFGINNDDITFQDLEVGEHVISVEAVDRALNISTSSFTWTIEEQEMDVPDDVTQADHVVISEILFGTAYSADEEFIELYNPTEQTIDLANYRLTRRNSNGTESILVSAFGSSAKTKIYKRSFLLIAPTSRIYYNGSPREDSHKTYTNTGNRITDDNTIILYSDSGNTIVDKVGYNNAVDFEGQSFAGLTAGKSIERKYRLNSTYETMSAGDDRYYGNGYDTDNNADDFIIRDVAEPQYWDWEDGEYHPPVLW